MMLRLLKIKKVRLAFNRVLSREFKLLGLVEDDGKPLTNDVRIIV